MTGAWEMLFNFPNSAFWLKSDIGDSCFWQFQLLQILIWQKIQIIKTQPAPH